MPESRERMLDLTLQQLAMRMTPRHTLLSGDFTLEGLAQCAGLDSRVPSELSVFTRMPLNDIFSIVHSAATSVQRVRLFRGPKIHEFLQAAKANYSNPISLARHIIADGLCPLPIIDKGGLTRAASHVIYNTFQGDLLEHVKSKGMLVGKASSWSQMISAPLTDAVEAEHEGIILKWALHHIRSSANGKLRFDPERGALVPSYLSDSYDQSLLVEQVCDSGDWNPLNLKSTALREYFFHPDPSCFHETNAWVMLNLHRCSLHITDGLVAVARSRRWDGYTTTLQSSGGGGMR